MESEQISVTVKQTLSQDDKIREGQALKNKIKKKKLNKLRSVKLSKSPSLKPSTRRPKTQLRNIVVDFSSIDTESLSPPYSTSSSRTDVSQKSAPLLTKRSSFKKGLRTLTRMSSKKQKKPLVKTSVSVSQHDRSSVISSVKASPRASEKENSISNGQRSAKAFTRKASLRPLRVSNKSKRVSMAKIADSGCGGVDKATCSSALKDSKFGATMQVQHGVSGPGCEVDSAMKVCPFSYCSLHGHRHRANAPPLQRLISIRRRMLRNERSKAAQRREKCSEKRHGRAKKEGSISPVEEVGREFFSGLEDESDGGSGEEEEGVKGLAETPVGEGDSVDQTAVESDGFERLGEQVSKDGSESRDGIAETRSGRGSSSESLSELESEKEGTNREEKENLEAEHGAVAERMRLKDPKYVKMWRLMYKHTVRGLSESVENPSPLAGADEKTEQEVGGGEVLTEPSSSLSDRTVESVDESYQIDAVKLVQQAFDEILLPEIQELSPGREGVAIEGAKTAPEQRVSKSWSSLKKILILKRFVKAMDKVKRINRGMPRYLPLRPEPEAERVSLRRLASEERKSAEDWMLDFALQQVVSKLEPAQQRRVAMLVKAFETVLPLPDLDSSPRLSVDDRARVDKVRSFSSLLAQSGDEEGKCSDDFVGKTSSRGLVGDFLGDRKSSEAFFPGDQPDSLGEKPNSDESLSTFHEAQEKATKPPQKALNSSKFESETADTEPLQGSAISQEEESATSTDVAQDTQSGKQSYMRLWGFVYKHMMSSIDESDAKTSDNANETRASRHKDRESGTEKAILRRIEAIKLIEKAIDDIILPDNPDSSAEGQTSGSSDEEPQAQKVPPDAAQFSAKPAVPSDESSPEKPKGSPEKPISRNWSNLKKMILLKRFIKALEGAGAATRGFNPRAPRFLAVQGDPEAEKVSLRKQEMDERKSAEEWMVDHALQQAVARLTPARKRKVQLLVEAFETVTPSVKA